MHSPFTLRGLLVALLATVVGGLHLLQGTADAVLPHTADGTIAGLAAALPFGLVLWAVLWTAFPSVRRTPSDEADRRRSDRVGS